MEVLADVVEAGSLLRALGFAFFKGVGRAISGRAVSTEYFLFLAGSVESEFR